jgi:hypothetical protein
MFSGLFLGVAFVVEEEEAFEEFAAGVGVDGVAGSIVFGEVVDLVEVMSEIDGGAVVGGHMPAVGCKNGVVHVAVQFSEANYPRVCLSSYCSVSQIRDRIGAALPGDILSTKIST